MAITVGMGIITLLLALLTGGVYRDLTLRDEVREIRGEVQLKLEANTRRLKQHVLQFGVILRNSPDFQKKLVARDWRGLDALLRRQFSAPFASSGVLSVAQISLYDARLDLMSRAGRLAAGTMNTAYIDCGTPVSGQTGNAMPSISHTVCLYRNHLYLSVVLPVGPDAEQAYLEVLADLGYAMELLEEDVGMPLRLRAGNPAATIYRSPRWPEGDRLDNVVIVTTGPAEAGAQTAFLIDAAHDHEALFASLRETRLVIVAGSAAITIAIILVMLSVARRLLLDPVRDIIGHMRNVRDDKSFLHERIATGGIAEIRELADDFNAMSEELERLYDTLESMTLTDSLTRLGNRKQFHHNIASLVVGGDRRSAPFALLVMDLDKFKVINDTMGHKAGDQFLLQISGRFANVLRESDLVLDASGRRAESSSDRYLARLGGDEFAVLLPAVDNEAGAITVARKLSAVTGTPFTIEGVQVTVGVSIGIAIYPIHSTDKDMLIHMADLAMYQAKRAGTGYAVYDSSMEPVLSGRPLQCDLSDRRTKH